MNLKQMTVFREVMLTGSVSEAARNLNRTQPSVSHMIATLEGELGMKLFERRRGRLHPVPEAHYLFKECDEVLGRVSSVSENMKRIKAMEVGELRIVSMPGPASVLLPDMICQLVGPHPDIRATLLSRSSGAVIQLIGSQQFDIGIADHDPDREIEPGLMSAVTYQFNSICAVPAGDPLAALPVIRPADLSGHPMGALYPEHLSHQRLRETFDAADATLSIRFIGQFFVPLLTYVENGLACVIIDPLTAETWRRLTRRPDTIVFRRFEPAIAFGAEVLIPTYRPESLLARSFHDNLSRLFSTLGGVARTLTPAQSSSSASQ